MVGNTACTVERGTDRRDAVAVSASPCRTTPALTQSATGMSCSIVPSPSAITTSASQGVCSRTRWSLMVVLSGAASRSQGSVRRFSTICGSRLS